MAETVYLLLGSNLGNREAYLDEAVERLARIEGLEMVAVSGIYASKAVDMSADAPDFLNQVVKGEYQYTARELLHTIEAVEKDLGRVNKGANQPRAVDIDILLFGRQIIESDTLTVPHPRLLDRPFALIPLVQIDEDVLHPQTERPLSGYITDDDHRQVTLFKDYVARDV